MNNDMTKQEHYDTLAAALAELVRRLDASDGGWLISKAARDALSTASVLSRGGENA